MKLFLIFAIFCGLLLLHCLPLESMKFTAVFKGQKNCFVSEDVSVSINIITIYIIYIKYTSPHRHHYFHFVSNFRITWILFCLVFLVVYQNIVCFSLVFGRIIPQKVTGHLFSLKNRNKIYQSEENENRIQ